jgi:hypothetical protein
MSNSENLSEASSVDQDIKSSSISDSLSEESKDIPSESASDLSANKSKRGQVSKKGDDDSVMDPEFSSMKAVSIEDVKIENYVAQREGHELWNIQNVNKIIEKVAPLENDQDRQERLGANQLLLQQLMNGDGDDPESIENNADRARALTFQVRLETEIPLVALSISDENLRRDTLRSNQDVLEPINGSQNNGLDKSGSSYEEFVRNKTIVKGNSKRLIHF